MTFIPSHASSSTRLFFLALLAAAGVFVTSGCESSERPLSATTVIDSARAAQGAALLDRAVMRFRFRGDAYRLRHDQGRFHYRRDYTDSLGRSVTEGLTNAGLYRTVEGDTVSLSSSDQSAVETAVNSVAYFSLLPEPLDDPAVQPTYGGRDTIDGVSYHRVRVTFRQDGGGKDWEDVFVYWFRTDTYAMDYFAYAYGQGADEEAGTRFREAYNARRVGGVRVADYRNYTVDSLRADQMAQYPDLWGQGAARLVSRVELDSVRVRPL